MKRIGFMQGRLSPLIDGKIQAFPWDYWKDEFVKAKRIGLVTMEWTLDYERLYENPFMSDFGQKEILYLMKKYSISIPSLTGDCFMQSPFYKNQKDRSNVTDNEYQTYCFQHQYQ